MVHFQTIAGIIALFLIFFGHIPYIKNVLRKKTKPHIYSWLTWGLVTLIVFSIQFMHHAGIGAIPTFGASLICVLIFVLGLKNGKRNITRTDTIFFIFSLFALIIWLFIKQAFLAVVLLTFVEILGFIPTFRKSWHSPYSETLITYFINSIRLGLALFALASVTMITAFEPLTMFLINILFCILLFIRRGRISSILVSTN